nr:hypothetical protein Iba_chr14aCG21020 [Ipomoea batatas]
MNLVIRMKIRNAQPIRKLKGDHCIIHHKTETLLNLEDRHHISLGGEMVDPQQPLELLETNYNGCTRHEPNYGSVPCRKETANADGVFWGLEEWVFASGRTVALREVMSSWHRIAKFDLQFPTLYKGITDGTPYAIPMLKKTCIFEVLQNLSNLSGFPAFILFERLAAIAVAVRT